ncbi:hypothetical protein V2E39_22790 [Chryseobacterium arthrosphaerae]|uniref:Uncharacterized protein n=1 Tax=Chryseobacterium arthrosphaerae TaxID=651561 RepID=A0ABU7R681_9FLAO
MKLLPMTEFVLLQKEKRAEQKITLNDYIRSIENYADFLRQPITLGMFVPVDHYGKVLKNPHAIDEDAGTEKEELQIEFNHALEKILFEGFKIAWDGEVIINICLDDLNLAFDKTTLKSGMNYTIEHLCQYRLQFTTSALKQIGL